MQCGAQINKISELTALITPNDPQARPTTQNTHTKRKKHTRTNTPVIHGDKEWSARWSVERSVDPYVERSVDRSVDRSICRAIGRTIGGNFCRTICRMIGRTIDSKTGRFIFRSAKPNSERGKPYRGRGTSYLIATSSENVRSADTLAQTGGPLFILFPLLFLVLLFLQITFRLR